MSTRSVECIAIVQGARQGSGFLLDSRLVLTSAHLFEGEGEVARVAVPGGTGTHSYRFVWRRYDESCDAALLEADEDLVRGDDVPDARRSVGAGFRPGRLGELRSGRT
ncbi:hypothetical protein P8A21_40770 (plasmid) [Streptomyces poriferorum]|uniref:hypothetical protein n=1 Tax=Streptomyces poriferorum TaxID=2798799 RepID=UPI00273DC22B|nr:hypothetical protein [Streptomyces sp. Alt1]WLQ53855.1 hypothetical protein P8A21_40770 [Streptomyces sp. Alt1]